MPKPAKPEVPSTQQDGGSHVNEGKGDFKPPKQPAGPYDRDREGRRKVDEQGLPADDSKFG